MGEASGIVAWERLSLPFPAPGGWLGTGWPPGTSGDRGAVGAKPCSGLACCPSWGTRRGRGRGGLVKLLRRIWSCQPRGSVLLLLAEWEHLALSAHPRWGHLGTCRSRTRHGLSPRTAQPPAPSRRCSRAPSPRPRSRPIPQGARGSLSPNLPGQGSPRQNPQPFPAALERSRCHQAPLRPLCALPSPAPSSPHPTPIPPVQTSTAPSTAPSAAPWASPACLPLTKTNQPFQRVSNVLTTLCLTSGRPKGSANSPRAFLRTNFPKLLQEAAGHRGTPAPRCPELGGRTGWGHPLLAPGASLGTATPLSLLEAPEMMQGRHWWDWGHWGGFQALSPLSPIPISPLPPPPVPMEVGGPCGVALGGGVWSLLGALGHPGAFAAAACPCLLSPVLGGHLGDLTLPPRLAPRTSWD